MEMEMEMAMEMEKVAQEGNAQELESKRKREVESGRTGDSQTRLLLPKKVLCGAAVAV